MGLRSITGFIDSTFGLIGVGTIHVCVDQAICYKWLTEKYVSYFTIKTYVVGSQKNRLNETVLLSTHNIW